MKCVPVAFVLCLHLEIRFVRVVVLQSLNTDMFVVHIISVKVMQMYLCSPIITHAEQHTPQLPPST